MHWFAKLYFGSSDTLVYCGLPFRSDQTCMFHHPWNNLSHSITHSMFNPLSSLLSVNQGAPKPSQHPGIQVSHLLPHPPKLKIAYSSENMSKSHACSKVWGCNEKVECLPCVRETLGYCTTPWNKNKSRRPRKRITSSRPT